MTSNEKYMFITTWTHSFGTYCIYICMSVCLSLSLSIYIYVVLICQLFIWSTKPWFLIRWEGVVGCILRLRARSAQTRIGMCSDKKFYLKLGVQWRATSTLWYVNLGTVKIIIWQGAEEVKCRAWSDLSGGIGWGGGGGGGAHLAEKVRQPPE